MPRTIDVEPSGKGLRVGIAVARFNQAVTTQLLDGALTALRERGVADDAVDVVMVPGAFELPLCAQRLAGSGRYDVVVALGAVVRGDTPHFDFVAGEAGTGLMRVGLERDLPIAFGLLTTDTMEQALERAGGSHGNKGYDAALTGLEMVGVLKALTRY
jgi:6,7-dimethyl-8-ribityllumazine synthase